MIRVLTAVAVVLMLSFGGSASAEPNAEALTAEGVALAKAQKFREALLKFREASALAPKAELLCNIGMTYYSLDELDRAERFLSGCARDVDTPDPDVLKVLTFVVDKLQAGDFTRVRFESTPSGATVELDYYKDDPPMTTPASVYVKRGSYDAEISAADHLPRKITLKANKKELAVNVALQPVRKPKQPQRIQTKRSRGAMPWVLLGTGVVLSGVGVASHFLAFDSRDKAADANDENTYNGHVDDIELRETLAWSFYGVAAVSVAISAYLFARDPGTETQLSATPLSGGGMLGISWAH